MALTTENTDLSPHATDAITTPAPEAALAEPGEVAPIATTEIAAGDVITLSRLPHANRPSRARISTPYGHVDVKPQDGREVAETHSTGAARVLVQRHGFTRGLVALPAAPGEAPAEPQEAREPAPEPEGASPTATVPQAPSSAPDTPLSEVELDALGEKLSAMRLTDLEAALPDAPLDAVSRAVIFEQRRSPPRKGALLLFGQRLGVEIDVG